MDVEVTPLDWDLTPVELLRGLRGRHRLVALVGAWAAGEAVVAWDPVRELDHPVDGLDEPAPGTWIGWWGYRAAAVEPTVQRRPVPRPSHVVGCYDRLLRRVDGRWRLEQVRGRSTVGEAAARRERFLAEALEREDRGPAPHRVGDLVLVPTPDQHRRSVARGREHIAAGDVFQVNVTARLEGDFAGDPLDLFCAGVEALRPAHGAFVADPGGAVASFSPELFLHRAGAHVVTSPIKGTAPLGSDPDALAASGKDRAENVMIVDLMRNDLGRVAETGSVQVPALNRVERHAVWHLVSDVTARLRPGTSDADLLRATFPPGSVTGAPKVRAVEVLDELEPTAREAYTGAIGLVGPDALELNVAIRTVEVADGRLWLGVGGGIVWDSDPDAELEECLVKARPIAAAIGARLADDTGPPTVVPDLEPPLRRPGPAADPVQGVLETALVVDGTVVDVDAHLCRLAASRRELWDADLPAALAREVAAAARSAGPGRARLRIEAVADRTHVDVVALDAAPSAWRLARLDVPGGWGAHKWRDRAALAPPAGADGWLLVDGDDVLETDRASLFVVTDHGVRTPLLDGRLLPGTARARVVEALRRRGVPVVEAPLRSGDLADAVEVFATNALRGAVPVTAVEGVGSWVAGPVTRWVADLLADRTPPETLPPPRSAPGARVLVVDSYDSFVYNLAQHAAELGAEVDVVRHDAIDVAEAVRRRRGGDLTHLVLSPGPGRPEDAGVGVELVRALGPTTPVLGVCLGHQVVVTAYGGRVVRGRPVHGKPSLVLHDGAGVHAGLPDPLVVARYHALVADPAALPDDLLVTSRTPSGVVMGVRHRHHPVEGVQWHPESVLTPHGRHVLATFLAG